MSLNQNKIQNFKNNNNIFKRNSFDSKASLKLNTNNKPSNQSKIFDITYKLFSNQYKNIKDGIKIKKIEAKYKINEKRRCKTIKKKNNYSIYSNHSKNSKKKRINSALIENSKINRVNSIIININNSQFNKTNIKHNNSFRNIANSQMNEQYFSSSTNTKPHKNNYYYDFSTNKKQSNDKNSYFNSYNTNTYNFKSKNYNFHKIEPKPNNKSKNRTNEQINFKIYKKNPIKIKTNAISNKLKNKMYIIKKHSSDKSFNISINNKPSNSVNKLHKFLSSKNLNSSYKASNINNINNNFNFGQKSAEENYLEKWQFYIGENMRKKRSLSQMNSNKNYNSIFQKNYGILDKNENNNKNKNKILSQREDKNMKNLYYLNNTKNSINPHDNNNDKENDIRNSDLYNYTENNQEYNNKIMNDFLLETIQKDKIKKQYETEKKILNINDNKVLNANANNFHKNYYIDKEKNIENYKIKEYDSINKIIERKKREIDLLNVMKFTSEIYFNNNNNNNNNESKVNNKNMNFFNNKDIFYENNKYHVINSNEVSEKNLYFKDNNSIYNVNSIDNIGFLLDKNNNTNNNTNDDLASIININTLNNDNI